MRKIVFVAFCLLLAGCATPFNATVAETVSRVQSIPEWYLNPPADESAVYAVATAQNRDIQDAMDLAKAFAVAQIAERLQLRVGVETNISIKEADRNGDRHMYGVDAKTNISLATQSPALVGIQYIKTEIMHDQGVYHVYVMAMLPLTTQALK